MPRALRARGNRGRTLRLLILLTPAALAGFLAWNLARSFSAAGIAFLLRPSGDPRFAWPLRVRDRVNVLLIGTDVTLNTRRQVVSNLARADTLILMSFDPHTRTAHFLSIPRDTRVYLPGHGPSKINASYAFGGVPLTVRAVEDLLGVRVHYYLKMGADSFARLVDAVGGVWVDVEQEMHYRDWWGGFSVDLKKGRQLLMGDQAMGYARFRMDALGDIGRVQRQQKVIRALFARMREPQTVLRFPQLLHWFHTRTHTNLNLQKVLALGWFLRGVGTDRVRTATLPGHFAPLFWEPDEPRVRALVLEMFYGVDPQAVAQTRVEVLNASEVPGMAREVAARLARMGFPVVRVDLAPRPRNQTAIISHRGDARLARAVRETLGTGALATRPTPVVHADLTVLVGRDYAHRRLLARRPVAP
ncbi:MAG: LCP family protein [Armatimonadota bacterium]|nr:LCP family protein [Armatimonadota bacterium]